MGRRAVVVLALAALPLVAAVVFLAVTGRSGGSSAQPAVPAAYVGQLTRICAAAERGSALDPALPPHLAGLGSYVEHRLARARAFRRALAATHAPPVLARFHARLAGAAHDEVTTLGRLVRAVARRDTATIDALVGHFLQLNDVRDRAAAWLGLPDCLRVQGADPHSAYPPAPRRGGRSLLPAAAFARAVERICGDNQARAAQGKLLIDQEPESASARAAARRRFARQTGLRLRALLGRLGMPASRQPPSCRQRA